MTAQGGSSGYSYYASQTVRTLRGLLDAGVNATGWSSSSTTSRAWASTFTSAEQVDTLRPNGLHERDGEVPGLPRRSSGAGKKISRPSVNQLFDVPQHHEEESVIDQQAAKKVEVPVRHNNLKSSSGDNANNGRLQGPQLDRVLFHTGPSRDPYNPDSNEELPLLALCPCNLPQELTDLIVSQLSNRLDSYAQEPYMLIIFASPSNPIPVQHLIRYYRGLSSEIRRNIQRVWICHAGLFTKM